MSAAKSETTIQSETYDERVARPALESRGSHDPQSWSLRERAASIYQCKRRLRTKCLCILWLYISVKASEATNPRQVGPFWRSIGQGGAPHCLATERACPTMSNRRGLRGWGRSGMPQRRCSTHQLVWTDTTPLHVPPLTPPIRPPPALSPACAPALATPVPSAHTCGQRGASQRGATVRPLGRYASAVVGFRCCTPPAPRGVCKHGRWRVNGAPHLTRPPRRSCQAHSASSTSPPCGRDGCGGCARCVPRPPVLPPSPSCN